MPTSFGSPLRPSLPADEPAAKILALVEPNLEADMDGWMAWFDRIKEIVELLAV